jgi:TolB protein
MLGAVSAAGVVAGAALWLLGGPEAAGGAVIAYTQTSGATPHVWTIDVDRRGARQLTRGRYGEETPSWSPDGRNLAYAETRPLSSMQIGPVIAIRSMSTGRVRAITGASALDETPTWSPAGSRIAFVRTIFPSGTETGPPEEIWTVGTDGRGARQLTRNSVSDIGPAWSPTGAWLAFQRARDGSGRTWDLWTMRADGSRQRRLARNATRPAWAPNRVQIAFGEPTGAVRGCCLMTDLMVIDSNGSHRRLLVRNGGRPAWSPDGSRIVFQRMNGQHFDLWVINRDGTGLRRLTWAAGDEYAAAWRP